MARPRPPDPGDPLDRSPSDVEITVLPGPRGPLPWERIGSLGGHWTRRVRAGLAIAAAIAAAAVAAVSLSGSSRARTAGQSHLAGAAGVAAAYRYPLRCLRVTTAPGDPTYARAELDRVSPCWRYGVYVTAIFHRADGAWRLVLDARRYACPIASLPRAVQAQLGLCPPEAGG